MPLDMQAKLLRAIEEKAFRRVGGTNLLRVDVQVLAASNRSLPKLMEQGNFREDLFYRLKVVDLHIRAAARAPAGYPRPGRSVHP